MRVISPCQGIAALISGQGYRERSIAKAITCRAIIVFLDFIVVYLLAEK